jgi:hypothetical protein
VAGIVVGCCPGNARAQVNSTVIVRSERADLRYELVNDWSPTPAVIRSCERYRVACRHLLPVGEYTFAVPPVGDVAPKRRKVMIEGDTLIAIKPGSRTVQYLGRAMMIVGGIAAVGGFFAYGFAVTGGASERTGPNTAATVWSVVTGTGIMLTLVGGVTLASGATQISVTHRF